MQAELFWSYGRTIGKPTWHLGAFFATDVSVVDFIVIVKVKEVDEADDTRFGVVAKIYDVLLGFLASYISITGH